MIGGLTLSGYTRVRSSAEKSEAATEQKAYHEPVRVRKLIHDGVDLCPGEHPSVHKGLLGAGNAAQLGTRSSEEVRVNKELHAPVGQRP